MQELCINELRIYDFCLKSRTRKFSKPLYFFIHGTLQIKTMAAATETFRTTLRRHKYSPYSRNKDQESKKPRNIIKSPLSFHVPLRSSHLSTILSADYEQTSYNTTDHLYCLHSNNYRIVIVKNPLKLQ